MTKDLASAIKSASELHLSHQFPEGYWWYTLEANEYINAEYLQLMHFLGAVDKKVEAGICKRILSQQREDGSWALYFSASGDLSTTIECYWVLKLAGHDIDSPALKNARKYILENGGIVKARVFTKIHLALFGIVPWNVTPRMPASFILLPTWMPFNVYEFSSWARACIIPLLVINEKKPVRKLPDGFSLEELFCEPPEERAFKYSSDRSRISWENFFIQFDKWLKFLDHLPIKPLTNQAIKACEDWIVKHIEKTEDIYPAMAYSAMALSVLGHSNEHPTIAKCLNGLKRFQQTYKGNDLPALPVCSDSDEIIYQQCCISPNWDTPWSITALLDAGTPTDHPALVKSGQWLIKQQVLDTCGDWRIKNPHGEPGGWAFEFQNDYFPDVDDTIQIIAVLDRLSIPDEEKGPAIKRGLNWILSMQNDDGGWAAFDKNNDFHLVNKIPFSDHGACLDPSSPDITGRMIELLSKFGFTKEDPPVVKAMKYLSETQEAFGGWLGRWGINYIYGTWCVLRGLAAIGENMQKSYVRQAVEWLKGIQLKDGGFSESPETYVEQCYLPYPESVPSQTAWALMGLMAAGEKASDTVKRGIDYLVKSQTSDGSWDEKYSTGTGFPGHFYIRYHGYRHFFPLMALANYNR